MNGRLATLRHSDHLWSGQHICSRGDRWERRRWGLNASSLDEIWRLKRHTDRSPNSLCSDSWASVPNMTRVSPASWWNGRKTSSQTEWEERKAFYKSERVGCKQVTSAAGLSREGLLKMCLCQVASVVKCASDWTDRKSVAFPAAWFKGCEITVLLSHTKVVHGDVCGVFFFFPVELKAYRKWCNSPWLLFSIVIFCPLKQ